MENNSKVLLNEPIAWKTPKELDLMPVLSAPMAPTTALVTSIPNLA
jgi:hypothetical protein